MEKYIGTKIIHAEPAYRYWMEDGQTVIVAHDEDKPQCIKDATAREDGYKVVYAPDGYESWSPKYVFEAAYHPTSGMNFGLALEAAKMGKRIARHGWNGKGQYVEIGTDFAYRTLDDNGVLVAHEDIGTNALVFVGTRGRQVGWLASQADMLADDWYIVE